MKTKLEPRTASAAARLRVIRELRAAQVPASVMVAPVIPFINDDEIEDIVAAAADAGALSANYILLRLPLEVKELFHNWLLQHYPLKADRVMNAIRSTRGGRAYDPTWGKRMRGEGSIAELIGARFHAALKRHDLDNAVVPELRTDLFSPPGDRAAALDLIHARSAKLPVPEGDA